MLCPDPLRPGDAIRIIAPSGPFDRTLVLRGMGWLSERYRVRFDWNLFDRDGFLAGNDPRRLRELDLALAEPDVHAVVAARGGYGLTRIAQRAAWPLLRRYPKWLVGFSDSTVLHVEAARVGVASLHADNVGGLGRGSASARQAWLAALEAPTRTRCFEGLGCVHPGSATGPLFGGNLSVLEACAAGERLRIPAGAVLALEDVNEAPYRIDRMLTALLTRGALDAIAAVVIGDFTGCNPGVYGTTAEQVLAERLSELRVPIVRGLRFGHGSHNEPLPFGVAARVDADAGRFVLSP